MLLLLLSWVCYYFIHSALASLWVKEKVRLHYPKMQMYYRIIYNGIAIVSLIPLLYMSLRQPIDLDIPFNRPIGIILSCIGLFFMRKAFQAFDIPAFLGIKPEEDSAFVTTGMYAYVRHPLYFASILLIGGLTILFPSKSMLLVMGISYAYILIGSKLEERKLKMHFGQAYEVYAQKVKALIPYVY